eukprot:470388_1
MALSILDNLIAKFEYTVSQQNSYGQILQFRKIPLSSLQNIKSSPNLIKQIQDDFSNYKFLIFSNDNNYNKSLDYINLIKKTKALSLDFFTSTSPEIKNKLSKPRPGYMKTVAKEFFDYRLVNKTFENEYYEQLICSKNEKISKFQTALDETFICLENITKDIVDILSYNNKLNGIINNSNDLHKFGAIGKPSDNKQKVSASKLSIFYYHNDAKYKDNVNCSEHIDQGFLSLEPISSVSGLEIEYEKNKWIRIDDEKFNLNENDLILFSAETFQRLSGGKYMAAMHRVGKNDKERLTIVYKMKHRNMENDLKLHFGEDENYHFYQYDENGNLVRIS